LKGAAAEQKSWVDKGTSKAAALWSNWEKRESGWQKKVVEYGNGALKRIPYEEWGLKSIPPLSARRQQEELSGKEKVEVHFPPTLVPEATVRDVLKTLGTERQVLHKSRLIWSFVGIAITAPIGILPIIPNLPCYYLIFRAWSHWRALKGSQHVAFLLEKSLIVAKPSQILDELYSTGKQPFDAASISGAETLSEKSSPLEEKMVLQKSNGNRIAGALEIPELDVELDRAVWQVEKALKAQQELKQEQKDLANANMNGKDRQ
jgi:hypothetical protein